MSYRSVDLPAMNEARAIAATWPGPTELAMIITSYARPTKAEALITILERAKRKNITTIQIKGARKLNIMWPAGWNAPGTPWRERRYCIAIAGHTSEPMSFAELFDWPRQPGVVNVCFMCLQPSFHALLERTMDE